jgi:hypothetical protein
MFGSARTRLDLVSKAGRQKTHRITVKHIDGTRSVREVDERHLLGVIAIPAFRMAKYYYGTQGHIGPDIRLIITNRADDIADETVHSFGVRFTCDTKAYARLLAKIAHGILVAHLGVNGFRPRLRCLILGEDDDFMRLVGGFCEEIPKPEKTDGFHKIHATRHEGDWIVQIQLFSEFGGPVNYVVAGACL